MMSDHDHSLRASIDQPVGETPAQEDIDVPPVAGLPAEHSLEEIATVNTVQPKPSAFKMALMASVILIGGFFLLPGSAEKQHANWQQVERATEASTGVESKLVHVAAGEAEISSVIEFAASDRNRTATANIRQAMTNGEPAAAIAHLQEAQIAPVGEAPVQLANVAAPLADALKRGEVELYNIELFDCCDEDGDVVEVLVNDVPFAMVPILHQGIKLAIPLRSGSNSVSIRGVRDGGGGITVGFRTSRGDYIARYLRVGQDYRLGVVVP